MRTAAETFRQNPKLDVAETIMEMGVGEALVSVLEDKGTPSIVQRTLIRPPQSRIGPVTDSERAELLRTSPFSGRYDNSLDRESAYELLQKRTEQATEEAAAAERKTVRRHPSFEMHADCRDLAFCRMNACQTFDAKGFDAEISKRPHQNFFEVADIFMYVLFI